MHDKRFRDKDATRRFLNDLEDGEQDQPQTLNEDLQILRESGIDDQWLSPPLLGAVPLHRSKEVNRGK
jgi:hypothetical protein